MMHLSEELISQILMRLPVKYLLRFKCVCKLWFSLISDPNFAISHFELAAAPTYRLLYLPNTAYYASQTYSIDLDASSLPTRSASTVLNLSFVPPTCYPEIRGSCRGFILLRLPSNLCLWNPSTGFHKPLSLSPIHSNEFASFFTFLYGFGYDPSENDYLVVSASYDTAADLETYFELFSMRANAWKRIEGTHLPYMNGSDDPRAGTLLNAVIHWLACRYDDSTNVILAFDLVERSFSEVPLPADFYEELTFCNLCVLGGLLSLCVSGGDATEIWVMEEYKVQSSWTKSIIVSLDDLTSQYFSPICSTKNGDIVGVDGSTGLMKFNVEGQLLEQHSYCDDPHRCEAVMYRESLLSLPVDIVPSWAMTKGRSPRIKATTWLKRTREENNIED